MTLITVAHPRFALEIRHCVGTFRRFAREPFEWVMLTEACNVDALAQIVPEVTVVAMAPEAEAVSLPYMRQMAAKLYAWQAAGSARIVITDDDTESIGPWSEATFFDERGRARYWYQENRIAFWGPGQSMIFGGSCVRDFQLRLPFAIRRESLQALSQASAGKRCMEAWHSNRLVSEFNVMGEWAWREPERAERSVFCNTLVNHGHWSIGRAPVFRDWQSHRSSLRKRILKGRGH